jgi:outer membrane immunogenic protein
MKMVKSSTAAATLAVLTTFSFGAHAAELAQGGASAATPSYPSPVPNWSWTGFYIGYNIGGQWDTQNVSSNFGSFWNVDNIAFIGGGQTGYNYQVGGFVVGVEGDLDWMKGNKSSPFIQTALGPLQAVDHWNWTSSVALRLGFAANCALFYGKFGYGWNSETLAINSPVGLGVTSAFASNVNGGGLIGAGVEYAVTEIWTAKIEYDYSAVASRTFVVAFPSTVTLNPNIQMLKVGFNYKM